MASESMREIPLVVHSNQQISAKILETVTAQVVAAANTALGVQDDSITADTTYWAAFGSDSLGKLGFVMEIDELSDTFTTEDERTQWGKQAKTMSMSDIAKAILTRSPQK